MTNPVQEFDFSLHRELTISLDNENQMEIIEMATGVDFAHEDGEYETTPFSFENIEDLKEYAEDCSNNTNNNKLVKNIFSAIITKHGEFDTFRFYYAD